ncbi:MAG TPA: helix-turn-helix domain-containing protein [Chitinophagaceae bacterium]|nr:helix-turn-helix domain-containing protein [Chitinophagaceae bacterium]
METRNRILEKADELFMQYGIRSVSMDDIANGLGMSKKTLYQHFADKDALVEAVVDLHIIQMQEDCSGCRTNAKDAIGEIFNTMELLMEEFSNMNPMVLYDLEKFHFKAYQKFRQHKDSYLMDIVKKNLEWGIDDEIYRPDINVDIMSKYRMESMMLPFNVALFPPGKYNLAETSNLMLEHFIYGVATLKGHKLIQKYSEQRQKK